MSQIQFFFDEIWFCDTAEDWADRIDYLPF